MSSDLSRLYRQMKVSQSRKSPAQIEQERALAGFIDPATGQIADTKALAPYLPLEGEDWGNRKRVRQPSVLVLVAAEAGTPPSTGDALITFTQKTEAGIETLVILTIPKGHDIASFAPMIPVPAGAWLGYTVTNAAGVSDISISYSLKVGQS